MYFKAWVPRQKTVTGAEPLQRQSTRTVPRGNVGLVPSHKVSTTTLLSEAVGRGPPLSRPQNGTAISSSHAEPQALNSNPWEQPQVLYPAMHKSEAAQSIVSSLLVPMCSGCGTGSQRKLFWALRCNDCPAGFQICMASIVLFFWLISLFQKEKFTQSLYHHCILM